MKRAKFSALLGLALFGNPFGPAPAPTTPIKDGSKPIYAGQYDIAKGVSKWNESIVNDIDAADYMQYTQVDFGAGKTWFGAAVSVANGYENRELEVHIDSVNSPAIGSLKLSSTTTWSTFVPQWTKIQETRGIHDVFIVGKGGNAIANLYAFLFSGVPGSSSEPAPMPQKTGSVPKPGSLQNLTVSGPLVLQSGKTYSNLRITNPNGPCLVGQNVSNVRITNSDIGPCGGDGADQKKSGIEIYDSSNIRVDHNVIHDVSRGYYSVRDTGSIFDHNYVYNLRGNGPAGQMAQYDNSYGAGNKILCNIGANTDSDTTEDNINLWMSHGTPASYIEVAYNRIRGGHSKTGSGIILGDGEGSAYIDVHDNTIVNVNNAGIGVAGGTNMKVRNNRIYNNGANTSVGLSVRNFYSICDTIEVTNNRVWAFDRIWNSTPQEWHFLNKEQCSNFTESGNVFGDTSLNIGMFDEPYTQCNE